MLKIKKKQSIVTKNSFKVMSIGRFLLFLTFNPKVTLYHILVNPINPITLAISNSKAPEIGFVSKRLEKIKNSQINFIVPGSPAKAKTINQTIIAKFGVV